MVLLNRPSLLSGKRLRMDLPTSPMTLNPNLSFPVPLRCLLQFNSESQTHPVIIEQPFVHGPSDTVSSGTIGFSFLLYHKLL